MSHAFPSRRTMVFARVGDGFRLVPGFHTTAQNQGQLCVPNDICIEPETLDESVASSRLDTLPPFLPVEEHIIKTTLTAWREEGVLRALEVLSEGNDEGSRGGKVAQLASFVLYCVAGMKTFCTQLELCPDYVDPQSLCESHAAVSNWSSSVFRAFSLHPSLSLLAIARQDDVIELRGYDGRRDGLLKDKRQKRITCLAWAPFSMNLLAVGVESGVVLWHIKRGSSSTSASCTFLEDVVSLPVTCLSWCPKGTFLAAGSPANSSLSVWDTSLLLCMRMRRKQGGGLVEVRWSLDGQRVLAASSLPVFWVWDPGAFWRCERWTNLAGHCKTACWSPNSELLLFALSKDPSLYCLQFSSSNQPPSGGAGGSCGSTVAMKVLDLSPDDQSSNPTNACFGGCVQSMAWDRSGQRLAVLFTQDSPGADRVSVFHTRCFPALELLPGGYLQGLEGEHPILIDFSPCRPMLLVICWSSGRISFSQLQTPPSAGQVPTHRPHTP